MEQVKNDRKNLDHRKAYGNPTLFGETQNHDSESFNSGVIGGQHTQKRVNYRRIQSMSGHSRKPSGATTTQSSRMGQTKLTARHPQPSKGICVLKSRIGHLSNRDTLRTNAAVVEPIDDEFEFSRQQMKEEATRNKKTRNSSGPTKAFQTL